MIPGSGRSPGEGNGNPLHYSCLENPMEKGAWQSTVHWVERIGHGLATKSPPQFFKCLLEFTSETFNPGLFFVDRFLITGSNSTCLFYFLFESVLVICVFLWAFCTFYLVYIILFVYNCFSVLL